jgi:hypothetical protein
MFIPVNFGPSLSWRHLDQSRFTGSYCFLFHHHRLKPLNRRLHLLAEYQSNITVGCSNKYYHIGTSLFVPRASLSLLTPSSSSQECPDIYYLLSVLSQDLPSSKVLFNHYHGPGLSLFPDLLV